MDSNKIQDNGILNLLRPLLKCEYCQSHLDYSLFTKKQVVKLVIMLVFVDDILVTENDAALIQESKTSCISG